MKENKPETVDSKEAIKQKITKELEDLGVAHIPEIVDSLMVLEENSHFNDDARAIIEGIRSVLEFVDSFKLKPIEEKRLLLGAYLGDIGKAYTLEVAKLFSIENVENREVITVGEIIKKFFPNEASIMTSNLSNIGVETNMTMLEFYDKHAYWTKEILDRYSNVIDKETRTIAASHHLDRGIDPYKIKPKDPEDLKDAWKVSNNEVKFSILLLMAMDKYQAFIVRSKKSHGEAIKLLKDALRPFDGDDLKDIIVKAIEQLGATNSVFPEDYISSRDKKSVEIIN